jgi:hypothetical protein
MSDRRSKVHPPFVHDENSRKPAVVEEQKIDQWSRQQLGAFDWKSAASLRAPEKPREKAERVWDATDWEDPRTSVSSEARRVAEQLDAVAQKIRNGELSVDGKAPTPETAMAAALEALIRAK